MRSTKYELINAYAHMNAAWNAPDTRCRRGVGDAYPDTAGVLPGTLAGAAADAPPVACCSGPVNATCAVSTERRNDIRGMDLQHPLPPTCARPARSMDIEHA